MAVTITPTGVFSEDNAAWLSAWKQVSSKGGKIIIEAGVCGGSEGLTPFPNGPSAPVTIEGEGIASKLKLADPGANLAALNLNQIGCRLVGLEIVGPSKVPVSQATLFQAPAEGWGVRAQDGCPLYDVTVSGFWANVVQVGNHSRLYNVKGTGGYYNLLLGPGAETFGDTTHYSCDWTGATCASIGIHPDNVVTSTDWIDCHSGFAPYAIDLLARYYGPAGQVLGKRQAFTDGMRIDLAMESCGYGYIRDQGYGTPLGRSIEGARFYSPAPGPLNAAYRKADEPPAAYTFQVDTVDQLEIDQYAGPLAAGTEGTYQFAHQSNVSLPMTV